MPSELDILKIELNQAIKIQQNKAYAEERVLKALEESQRILESCENKISMLKSSLKTFTDAAESGGLISNETIQSIKTLIK
jgi:hypothetical protein